MKDVIQFLTALCVLAIVQYLALAFGVALLALLLMAAVVHPRRTLQLLATVALLALALRAPAHCAAAIGATSVAMVLLNRLQRRPGATPPLFLRYEPAASSSGSNPHGNE